MYYIIYINIKMSYNQQFKKDLFKLLVSNPDFISNILKYELPLPIETKDENNNTVLNRLLIENDTVNANLLLKNIKQNIYSEKIKNMLLNDQNEDGNAPIHVAILNNNQDIAKTLYKLGADMSKANKDNFIVEFPDNEKKETCNKNRLPMPPPDINMFERPRITMPPPIMDNMFDRPSINYVAEYNSQQNPNRVKPNDIKVIIEQLSGPINNRIPETLDTVNSTEMMPQQFQKRDSLDEFKFLQNFLEKSSNSNTNNRILSDNANSINTADFMQFLRQNKQMRQQEGGNNSSVNTNEFLKYISQQNIQEGGNITNQVISGTRQINKGKYETDLSSVNSTLDIKDVIDQQRGGRKSYRFNPNKIESKPKSKQKSLSSRSRSRSNGRRHTRKNKHLSSRSLSRPSSDLHQEVVDILKKNYSLSEDDARYIKAGFYHMIKDKFPNLSNMQRALKLKEISMNESEVNQMKKKLPELKEIVTKARELKKNSSPQNSNSSKTPKENKKVKDLKEKKPKKK